jgi:LPXTG-motif cell wall-anchored protein
MKKWVAVVALGAWASFGGAVGAQDYPPGGDTPPKAATGGDPPAPSSELAATGSETDNTLKIAGGALVAGVGLVLAAKVRRRPAAA